METARESLRTAYDQDAARRDGGEPEPWRLAIVDRFLARIDEAPPQLPVLELGCGTGQLAHYLADRRTDVVGLDLSLEMIRRTRARGVTALVADFLRLPFADASFAAALAFNSFLHVPARDRPALFGEVARVLADDGVLTVVTWGGVTREGPLEDDWLEPPRFFATFDDDDLLEQPTPGFVTESVVLLPDHASHGVHPQAVTYRRTRGADT